MAVYGIYALASNTLTTVGFTFYSTALAACSCTSAAISGVPELLNTTLAVSSSTTLRVITSELTDTFTLYGGFAGISNFCGQYKFALSSSDILLTTLPDSVQACSKDCGYYNNYTLAEIGPFND